MTVFRNPGAMACGRHQQGAVLFVSLMFLIIITLLAVTSSGTSILEERMTGGLRNRQLASFSADTALRAAESFLWQSAASGKPLQCTGTPTPGVYCYNPTAISTAVRTFRTSHSATTFVADSAAGAILTVRNGNTFDLTNPAAAADKSSQLASNPYVMIEDLGVESGVATGTGGSPLQNSEQHDNRDSGYGTGGGGGGGGGGGSGLTKHIWRITARSLGGTNTVVRVVESTFSVPVDTGA